MKSRRSHADDPWAGLTMIPADVIARKRDGHSLTQAEIAEFIRGFTAGSVADYQMSAMAMAIYLQGMSIEETVTLTREMLHSGRQLSRDANQIRVDKHSTGGLGDKVSLVLAPLLACCDLVIPMISGRGLGITGGTLDKLESIPGFQVDRSTSQIQQQLAQVGCIICGAMDNLAPADRKLYALRDVTGTIESVPLITASILSKKLAENLDHLVLDVKFGSAAFMPSLEAARELATMLVDVAGRLGVPTTALLTDMNQPLGDAVGNALEVAEAIEVLQGEGPHDVRELTCRLGAQLLISSGLAPSETDAMARLARLIEQGHALERFHQMVRAQGGDLEGVTIAPRRMIESDRSGSVVAIDGRQLGRVVIELGGGRRRMGDQIDHAVGLTVHVQLGQKVDMRQPLVTVHASRELASRVESTLREAIRIEECDLQPPDLIQAVIGPSAPLAG